MDTVPVRTWRGRLATGGLPRPRRPQAVRPVVGRSIAGAISLSTVRRWLKQDALKPWQYQSWIFVRDPAFRPKAARVLDLYTRTFDGTALGEDGT
ncbi:hypothetical protein N4G69_46615 [Streptomyces mirabilis]|uniref:hypothetical protein n=1 Tax=Streptomyces mirabilis TaxID=68239 RepID=UPI0021C0098A|nr:hypothetical protein [Streptomyces mirabilis]MCT9112925.1 hypothetical protein [Streptomyces mirabilis]